jgi:hypothetical protein
LIFEANNICTFSLATDPFKPPLITDHPPNPGASTGIQPTTTNVHGRSIVRFLQPYLAQPLTSWGQSESDSGQMIDPTSYLLHFDRGAFNLMTCPILQPCSEEIGSYQQADFWNGVPFLDEINRSKPAIHCEGGKEPVIYF